MGGGLVADGELVIPGGDRPVALEPVNPAFDSVALLVQFGVEGWRAAAGAALVLAVADLVGLVWDGAPDPPSPQVGAVSPGTVGLISQHPPRPGAGTAPPRPGHPDTFQHGLELRTVTTLPRGDDDRQRLLPLLTRQMDLAGHPPPHATHPLPPTPPP